MPEVQFNFTIPHQSAVDGNAQSEISETTSNGSSPASRESASEVILPPGPSSLQRPSSLDSLMDLPLESRHARHFTKIVVKPDKQHLLQHRKNNADRRASDYLDIEISQAQR